MFAAATVFAYGCSDNFDDSALWKDIDGMYKSLNELKAQVTTMQQQLDALAAVVSGGAVTSITQDADGHYVLSYKDADKKTRLAHTLNGSSLALPRIVAALLENNQTPDGIRIPEALIPYTGFDMIK